MVGCVHHQGIPVVVAPFTKVDDTRRYGDPSQAVADAHLRLDFRLGPIAFSTHIWGQQEHLSIFGCRDGNRSSVFGCVIIKFERRSVYFNVFFEVRKGAAEGTRECWMMRLEHRPNTLVMESVRAWCEKECLLNSYG